MQIGPIIRALRHEKGWTQEMLALELEVTTSYVSRIERGERPLSTDALARIARALGTNVTAIYALAEGRPLHNDAAVAERPIEIDFSDSSLKLRKLFRQLNDDDRELLIEFARLLVRRYQGPQGPGDGAGSPASD